MCLVLYVVIDFNELNSLSLFNATLKYARSNASTVIVFWLLFKFNTQSRPLIFRFCENYTYLPEINVPFFFVAFEFYKLKKKIQIRYLKSEH